MTTILKMKIGLDGLAIDVLMVDYPGEDFRNALRKLAREDVKDLYEHYAGSEAALLLFDPERDIRAGGDPARREEQIERQTAHLSAIALEWAERSGQRTLQSRPLDVAIIVTKSDKEPGLATSAAARRFFRQYAVPLDDKIRRQADAVQYFPLSAIGQAATIERDGKSELVPGKDLDPKGYEAIMGWILQRRRWRRRRPWAVAAGAVACVIVLAFAASFGWFQLNRSADLATLDSPRLSLVEKLERSQACTDSAVLQQRTAIFREELELLAKELDAASGEQSVAEVAAKAAHLSALKPGGMQGRVDALVHDCRQKEEDLLLKKIAAAFDSHAADFRELCDRFLREHPSSPQSDKVREMTSRRHGDDEKAERERIKQIRVSTAANLAAKGEEIGKFVAKYRADLAPSEIARMRRAAELARRFSEVNSYTVTLKQSGGLTAAYYQAVVLYVNEKECKDYRSPTASTEVNWDNGDVRLQWAAGQSVRIVWRKVGTWGSWGGSDIATLRDDGPAALRLLGGQQPLTQIERRWEAWCNNPFIRFDVEGISEDDWKSFDLYAFPGDGW